MSGVPAACAPCRPQTQALTQPLSISRDEGHSLEHVRTGALHESWLPEASALLCAGPWASSLGQEAQAPLPTQFLLDLMCGP